MFPRWHILLGGLFGLFLWLVWPQISFAYALIVFASSVLIDFDHYAVAVLRTGNLGLRGAFKYHLLKNKHGREERKRGIRRKGDFHIFHTIEFHALVLALGLLWTPLIYVFIGMVFHSAVDFISLAVEGNLYRREFFLTRWIIKRIFYGMKKV